MMFKILAIFLSFSSVAYGVAANFQSSLARILVHEGGWNYCDKHDPGGCTLNGITQARWYAYLRDEGIEKVPLAPSMLKTREWQKHRERIYDRYYAKPCAFAELPRGLDYVVLDYCVNSGIARGGRALRCSIQAGYTMRECMQISRTYTIDDKILEAVKGHNTRVLIRAICDEREAFLRSLGTFPRYGVGWMGRLRSVCRAGALMYEGRSGSATGIPPVRGVGKAYDDEGEREEKEL